MFPRAVQRTAPLVLLTLTVLILYHQLFSNYAPLPFLPAKRLRIDSPWTRRKIQNPVSTLRKLPQGAPLRFPRIQANAILESIEAKATRETRLQAVRDAFQHSWEGYRERAWLADELKPVSGGHKDGFGNWSATLVDSLDTLWIMGLHKEFDEAVKAVAGIDFETSTSETISVFETTIRYLGGLLSAYELSGRQILLEKALGLGHLLYAAFDTPNRMPIPWFDWQLSLDGEDQDTINHAISADIGSLSMEFTKLSQLTGDMRFFDAVQRISDLFAAQQSSSSIPGLWPVFVDALNQDFATGNGFSFGALSDSLYEYTFKMHILLGGLLPDYRKMYESAIEAAKKHLFVRAMNPQNKKLLVSTSASFNDAGELWPDYSSQHLACFVGGMVGAGSKLYNRPEDLEIATMLTDGCFWGYEVMESGIMPETVIVVPCPLDDRCDWDESAWKTSIHVRAKDMDKKTVDEIIHEKNLPPGIAWIIDGRYILRPEAIESLFYMYRISGDVAWQDKAWKMFSAIVKATKAPYGYSAIENVAAPNGQLSQMDSMESFWTAETLKYFYLIFSEPDLISLDEWVFNTEAHPFRRALPKQSWWR